MSSLAPIVLFAYKRLDTLRNTIESLKGCELALQSDLIVFSDGNKNDLDYRSVEEVRCYLRSVKGFLRVKVHFSKTNKGLASSIISGVSGVLKKYNKIIVLEDDLVFSSNFLIYMNKALDFYEKIPRVFSISGYTIPINKKPDSKFDVYYLPRSSSWGWATWYNRWEDIDWAVSDYETFKSNKSKVKAFNQGGSDMSGMLQKQMSNKVDSWAIRWCFHQFKINGITVCPLISKVQNIGFSSDSTHTHVYNRFKTDLDQTGSGTFAFDADLEVDPWYLSQFQGFFSIKSRFVSKIYTFLYKLGLFSNNGC